MSRLGGGVRMEFSWTWWALPAFLAGMGAIVLAVVLVFLCAPHPRNRPLSILLFLEGVAVLTAYGLGLVLPGLSEVYGLRGVVVVCLLAMPPVYLLFLRTLDSPLVRRHTRISG